MASQLEELLVSLGLDATKFEQGMEKQAEKGKEFFEGLKEHALEFFGVMASVGALAAFTEHMIQSQVALGRLAKETHTTSQEIEALGMASEKEGGSMEGAMQAVEQLGTKLAAIGTALPRAKMAATALGIVMGGVGKSAEALGEKLFKGKGPIEAMDILSEKMQGMDFFRAKAALSRLGMSDAQVRLLIQGKEKMHELIDENKKYVASDADLARSAATEEMMKNLKFSMDKVTETIAQWVLPAMQKLGDALLNFSDWAVDHGQVVKDVLIGIAAMAGFMAVATIHSSVLSIAAWAAHSTMAMAHSVQIILAFFGVETHAESAAAKSAAAAGKMIFGWIAHAAQAVASAAAVVGGWIATGAAATWAGIQMAAAWIMGLGPIAWIIAGIAAVIGIIVALGVKFHVFEAAWGLIKNAAAAALNWIEDKLAAVGKVVSTVVSAFNKILGGTLSATVNSTVSHTGSPQPAYAGVGGLFQTPHAGAHGVSAPSAGTAISPATRNSIMSSSHHSDNSKHINIEKLTVETQATDAHGVANGVGGALENVVNQSDGAF
jgi:hypothetical protein